MSLAYHERIPQAFRDSADAILAVCQARAIRIVGYPSQCSGGEVTLEIVDPDPNQTYEWHQGARLSSERPYVGYRFYQGALGNTSNLIVDSTQSYRTVTPPSKPITYWVRVYFLNNPTSCFSDAALTIQ